MAGVAGRAALGGLWGLAERSVLSRSDRSEAEQGPTSLALLPSQDRLLLVARGGFGLRRWAAPFAAL